MMSSRIPRDGGAFATRRSRVLAAAAVLLTLPGCSDPPPRAASPGSTTAHKTADAPARQHPVEDVAALIGARLTDASIPLVGTLTRVEHSDLATLYKPGGDGPLWIDSRGRPTTNAGGALTVLEAAAAEGLNPDDYAARALRALASSLDGATSASIRDAADFDVAMSAAMVRYFRHTHIGRIDPRTVGFRLVVPDEPHDPAELLRSALTNRRIAETASELAPPLAQYRALRGMLARYRSLAADTTLDPLPPYDRAVRPGEPYSGLRPVHRRLVAVGDLPVEAAAPAAGALYEGPCVEGLKRFQIRHGLHDDGIIGKATHAALTVPLTWRVRQIELALERLRWLPDLADSRLVALNIPMFRLWAWDSTPPTAAPALGMRAIVGRALSTQTPVFVEDMRHVIVRPYWNVPRSILRNEILPIVEHDPEYLGRHDMEVVQGPGDDAMPVAATPGNLALLRQGVLRLRQRPGPRNALGLVKFVFPNTENVYLHGTPAQELFARSRRDFSHGCVRVEDPVSLAEWVLKDQPEWSRDRILAAMSAPISRRVDLTRPIQVVLFYLTAVVMPEDGTIHFADDIYRHDVKLDRALGRPTSVR